MNPASLLLILVFCIVEIYVGTYTCFVLAMIPRFVCFRDPMAFLEPLVPPEDLDPRDRKEIQEPLDLMEHQDLW